ncbi:WD40 repeat-like protein [Nadsonia fulvescens var. elongata DSM 6958]|uniref:WD40 repeat-like protein n=1 Tax=Nadsonia fulvescens var. elongata DSM 6958 TaxID=857566 RepID=A0A1E3PQX4_9ASCO|nr:WD40 repeat-like protein [Nadsonia fulvescens var. elongata DSM 6958]
MSQPYIATNSVVDAHKSDIYAVEACQKYTITASGDSAVTLWDNDSEKTEPITLSGFTIGVHHLSIDGFKEKLAAVGFDSKIKLFDLLKLQEIPLPVLNQTVKGAWAIKLSLDGTFLAISTVEGNIVLWDVIEDKEKRSFQTKGTFGTTIDISRDDKLVASGHENGGIYIFEIETGRMTYSLPGHYNAIRAVRFSPAGRFLAVSGDSKHISVYDIVSGEHAFQLNGHEGWVLALAWNPTGESLLSGSYDGKTKVWSIAQRTCVATQAENNSPIFDVCWLNKGWGPAVIGGTNQGFASVGSDKAVRWYREASGQ